MAGHAPNFATVVSRHSATASSGHQKTSVKESMFEKHPKSDSSLMMTAHHILNSTSPTDSVAPKGQKYLLTEHQDAFILYSML